MSEPSRPEESRIRPDRQPEDELRDQELEEVAGGRAHIPDVAKTPTPGGPVPVPYPNVGSPIKND